MLVKKQLKNLQSSNLSLHVIGQAELLKKTSKFFKKNVDSPKKTDIKPIVSFINQPKSTKQIVQQNQIIQTFEDNSNVRQEKIKQNLCILSENPYTQLESQYGDYNYDKELQEVLKNHTRNHREQYKTPRITLRTETSQKQLNKGNKFQRFQKFKTQIHQINEQFTPKKCKERYFDDFQQDFIKNLKKQTKQQKSQNRTKSLLKIYQGGGFSTQNVRLQQVQTCLSVFKNFMVIINKKLQSNHLKGNNSTSRQLHRRSQTQAEEHPTEQNQSSQIFQNYKKLKGRNKKNSSNYKLKPYIQKQANDPNIDFSSRQNMLEPFKNIKGKTNTQLKHDSPIGIENFQAITYPTSRVYMSPRGFSRQKLNQKSLKVIIKARQKQFFLPKKNMIGSPNFTYEQIKSRLIKIEEIQNKKRQNNSNSSRLLLAGGVKKNNEGSKRELIYVKKQNGSQQNTKAEAIKFNGISFKANLIKKHTEIYQNQVLNRMLKQVHSNKTSPKLSKLKV